MVLVKSDVPEMSRNGPKPVVTALSMALSNGPARVIVPLKKLSPEVEVEMKVKGSSASVKVEVNVFNAVRGLLVS